ncbi:hypothetical protein CMUS01_00215 [Colletotrichum musicola]|uniref:SH3 domain-containing protein n=1 Tax=Colletotrichum musicola TaxID=2175873 RepID=A0A8H6NZI1_9PEZI|nr:hypothetical protein CMUS01_00215 [Colletotrichum musicola]
MYIKVYWTKDGRPGSTTSGVFTVYDNSNLPVAYPELNARLAREMSRSDQNVGVDTDDSVGNGDLNPETTLSSATATASVTPKSSPSGSSDVGSGGGGGGLPAGAIAGIVVGSVLGIGLIAFLLWFFLRRRRRGEHGSNGAYGSGQGPHEYLADKETHARVTESPQSPYSDDGQHQQQPQPHLAPSQQEAAIPPSSATPAGRPSFAPYEEHTPIAARSLDDVNRGSGARSSTPNVNSNVSHLIEDGMTEDEIRRLEEEERALDAAIEQAGQTQGQRR